jgi:transcriptional regulator with XRE-family HTH domain
MGTKLLPRQREAPKHNDRKDSEMGYRKSSVDALLETDVGQREFIKEELALEAMEKIAELMELNSVTKSELARRTGNSKAYITQVLSGSRNMTVHTLAALAFALGYRIAFHATPLVDVNCVGDRAIVLTKIPIQPRVVYGDASERAQPAPTHISSITIPPIAPCFPTLPQAA